MKKYLDLIRVKHYIKNLFVFLPLFFSGKIMDLHLFYYALLSFLSFSLIASCVYIVNDTIDIKKDRAHPTKCQRPIASGKVSFRECFLIWLLLLVAGISISISVSIKVTYVLIFYLVMNILYSKYLKKISIIDVSIISIGFVLRLFVGGYSTGVSLSEWIILMTFLFAIFVALAKRRDDVILAGIGVDVRDVTKGYNLKFVDSSMVMLGAVIIVCYVMYALSASVQARMGEGPFYFTTYFVILAVLRYLQLAFVENNTGSPTKLAYSDKFLQITLFGWIVSYCWILYL